LSQKETTLDKAIRNGAQLYPSIEFRPTSSNEIEKIIKSLKTTSSQGYDETSAKILKWSAPFISSPLAYISIDLWKRVLFRPDLNTLL